MITCSECGASSQLDAIIVHNEPCRRTLGACRGCNNTSIAHDPETCTQLAKKWAENFEGGPGGEVVPKAEFDLTVRQLDTVSIANANLKAALRKALGRLREFERAAGVPMPEIGEIEVALDEVPL